MVDTQYNKKNFAIIGAGGLGRELFSWITQSPKFNEKHHCIGFIDDDLRKLEGYNYPTKILSKLADNSLFNYQNVLIAIANSSIKKDIHSRLEKSNTSVIGYIHPSVFIGMNTDYQGCMVALPNVIISCDTKIGKGVFINNGSQIGHDVNIEDYVNIMANVDIGGGCSIGANTTIGSGATILPGIKVPANTVIGAGSVVFRNIKESGTYVGNPAKKLL